MLLTLFIHKTFDLIDRLLVGLTQENLQLIVEAAIKDSVDKKFLKKASPPRGGEKMSIDGDGESGDGNLRESVSSGNTMKS